MVSRVAIIAAPTILFCVLQNMQPYAVSDKVMDQKCLRYLLSCSVKKKKIMIIIVICIRAFILLKGTPLIALKEIDWIWIDRDLNGITIPVKSPDQIPY